jgi:hypothetical protein
MALLYILPRRSSCRLLRTPPFRGSWRCRDAWPCSPSRRWSCAIRCPCGWVLRRGRRHECSVLGPQGPGGRRRRPGAGRCRGPCLSPARLWASFGISHTRTRTQP